MRSRATFGATLAMAALAGLLPGTAAGRAGDILLGTDGNGDVIRMDPGTGAVSPVASGSPLDSPSGLDFARDGALFTADYSLPGLVRINPVTGSASVVAEGPPFFAEPLDVEVGPDGQLYVAEEQGGFEAVLKVDPATGQTEAISPGGLLTDPYALTIRHRDLVAFVADGSGDQVVGVDLRTGAQQLVSDDPDLDSLQGIALAPNGTLYVLDAIDNQILRVDPVTGAATPITTGGLLSGNAYNIAIEPAGTIVVANINGNNVVRVDPANGAQSEVGMATSPEGIVVEPPRCAGRLATIVGSPGRDTLLGSPFPDVIASLGGRDVIRGFKGNDLICSGPGPDRVFGGPGRDRILGGPGGDRILGGPGTDRILGGAGRDRCVGGPGRDLLRRC